jgi:hypothetical protein
MDDSNSFELFHPISEHAGLIRTEAASAETSSSASADAATNAMQPKAINRHNIKWGINPARRSEAVTMSSLFRSFASIQFLQR